MQDDDLTKKVDYSKLPARPKYDAEKAHKLYMGYTQGKVDAKKLGDNDLRTLVQYTIDQGHDKIENFNPKLVSRLGIYPSKSSTAQVGDEALKTKSFYQHPENAPQQFVTKDPFVKSLEGVFGKDLVKKIDTAIGLKTPEKVNVPTASVSTTAKKETFKTPTAAEIVTSVKDTPRVPTTQQALNEIRQMEIEKGRVAIPETKRTEFTGQYNVPDQYKPVETKTVEQMKVFPKGYGGAVQPGTIIYKPDGSIDRQAMEDLKGFKPEKTTFELLNEIRRDLSQGAGKGDKNIGDTFKKGNVAGKLFTLRNELGFKMMTQGENPQTISELNETDSMLQQNPSLMSDTASKKKWQAEHPVLAWFDKGIKDIGQQIPMWTRDMDEKVAAIGIGALVGGASGAGIGGAAAMGKTTYELESGGAYLEYRQSGVDHDTAKKYAQVVGAINAGLETGELALLLASAGTGAVMKAILKSGTTNTGKKLINFGVKEALDKVEKGIIDKTGSKIAGRLGKSATELGLFVGAESTQEGLQGATTAMGKKLAIDEAIKNGRINPNDVQGMTMDEVFDAFKDNFVSSLSMMTVLGGMSIGGRNIGETTIGHFNKLGETEKRVYATKAFNEISLLKETLETKPMTFKNRESNENVVEKIKNFKTFIEQNRPFVDSVLSKSDYMDENSSDDMLDTLDKAQTSLSDIDSYVKEQTGSRLQELAGDIKQNMESGAEFNEDYIDMFNYIVEDYKSFADPKDFKELITPFEETVNQYLDSSNPIAKMIETHSLTKEEVKARMDSVADVYDALHGKTGKNRAYYTNDFTKWFNKYADIYSKVYDVSREYVLENQNEFRTWLEENGLKDEKQIIAEKSSQDALESYQRGVSDSKQAIESIHGGSLDATTPEYTSFMQSALNKFMLTKKITPTQYRKSEELKKEFADYIYDNVAPSEKLKKAAVPFERVSKKEIPQPSIEDEVLKTIEEETKLEKKVADKDKQKAVGEKKAEDEQVITKEATIDTGKISKSEKVIEDEKEKEGKIDKGTTGTAEIPTDKGTEKRIDDTLGYSQKVKEDFEFALNSQGIPLDHFRLVAQSEMSKNQNSIFNLVSYIYPNIVFFKNTNKNALPVNGIQFKGNIYINVNRKDSFFTTTMGHEFFHTLREEHNELFNQLMEFSDYVISDEDVAKYIEMNKKDGGKDTHAYWDSLSEDEIREEMVADEFGNNFIDTEFWKKAFQDNQTLFEKLVQVVIDIISKFNKSSKFQSILAQEQIDSFSNAFASAMRIIVNEAEEKNKKIDSMLKEIETESVEYTFEYIADMYHQGLQNMTSQEAKQVILNEHNMPVKTITRNFRIYGDEETQMFVDKLNDLGGRKYGPAELKAAIKSIASGKKLNTTLHNNMRKLINDKVVEVNKLKFSIRKQAIEEAFKDSKVRNEDGSLIPMYHGTNSVFNTFDKRKIGSNDYGYYGKGFYFTPDKYLAEAFYTNYGDDGTPNVITTFLNVENPYIVKEGFKGFQDDTMTENIKKKGYDGVIVEYDDGEIKEIVVFEPTQIKSPEGELFVDITNPDIRFSIKKYPLAPKSEWWGDADYEKVGAQLIEMTPDEFLEKAKPLKMDEDTRENVEDLKEHILSGKTLDPLVIYREDKTDVKASDGRHRAVAAKELGYETVPVIYYPIRDAKFSIKRPEFEGEKYKPRSQWTEDEKERYDFFEERPQTPEYKAYVKEKQAFDEAEEKRYREQKEKEFKDWKAEGGDFFKPFEESTQTEYEGFSTTTTGTSYYDNFLNPKDLAYMQDAKRKTGYIAEMSPDEYIDRVARQVFKKPRYVAERGLDSENINNYAKMMQEGTKFDMPYLEISYGNQEGRHRAMAAKKLGIEKIPVLVVTDLDPKFSIRKEDPPKKTIIGYKAFKVFKSKPGKLFPLYVLADQETPIGVWLDADIGEFTEPTKTGQPQVKSKLGGLSFRPGWHLGDLPRATHIGKKGPDGKVDRQWPDTVWCECEVAADVDWQEEANSRMQYTKAGKPKIATAEIKGEIPKDGFYRYKTNPNMEGQWIIAGSIKVNRVLTDQEVDDIQIQNNLKVIPREGGPIDLKKWGFDIKESIKNPFEEPSVSYFKDYDKAIELENRRREWIDSIIKGKDAIQLKKKDGSEGKYVIVHPSTKGLKYQITYFVDDEPWSDAQFDERKEVIDRLVEEGYGFVVDSVESDKPRFKISEEKNLVALHNISEEKLNESINLGGLAVPSIAVTLDTTPFSWGGFSLITLVGKKSLIDPMYDKRNKVFNTDVYSKRMPQMKQKVNEKKMYKLMDRLRDSYKITDDYLYSVEENIKKGEKQNAIENIKRKLGTQYQFLKEKGIIVPYTQKYKFSQIDEKTAIDFLKSNPEFSVDDFYANEKEYASKFEDLMVKFWTETYDEDAAKELLKGNLNSSGKLRIGIVENIKEDILKVKNKTMIPDTAKLREDISKEIAKLDYDAWMEGIFDGIFGEKYFSTWANGREKKIPYDIEKVFAFMKGKIKATESSMETIGSVKAHGAKQFKSIAEMHKEKRTLKTRDEVDQFKKEFDAEQDQVLAEVKQYYKYPGGSFFDLIENFYAAMALHMRGTSIKSAFQRHDFYDMPDEMNEKIEHFLGKLKQAPVEYFEAKPQRIIYFDEFEAAIVPEYVSEKTVERLKETGIKTIIRFKENENEKAWLEAMSKIEADVKFKIGKEKEQTIEPKTPNDIIKEITEDMDIVLKIEKLRGAPVGDVHGYETLLRIPKFGDLMVFLHNLGHRIDKQFDLSLSSTPEQRRTAVKYDNDLIEEELMVLGKVTAKKYFEPWRIRREGVAEFLRLMMVDNEKLKESAPNLYKYFSDVVDVKTFDYLEEKAQQLNSYLELPSEKKAELNIDFMEDSFGKLNKLKKAKEDIVKAVQDFDAMDTFQKLKTELVDWQYPIEWVAKKLGGQDFEMEMSELLSWSRGVESRTAFELNVRGEKDFHQLGLYGEDVGKSFFDIVAPVMGNKEIRQEFITYLVAQRAKDYEARGLVLPNSAAEYLETEKALLTKHPEFDSIAIEVRSFLDNNLKLLYDSGMIDNDSYIRIKQENMHYVPMRRIVEKMESGFYKKSGKIQSLRKLKGGKQDIIDVFESIIQNTYSIRKTAEDNLVKQKLFDAADKLDMPELIRNITNDKKVTKLELKESDMAIRSALKEEWESNEGYKSLYPNVEDYINTFDEEIVARVSNPNFAADPTKNQVAVYRNGKVNIYEVHPELYQALTGVESLSANMLIDSLIKIAQFQKKTIIYHPQFLFNNFFRDSGHNLVSSNYYTYNPLSIVFGMWSSVKDDKWHKLFQMVGGQTDYYDRTREGNQKLVNEIKRNQYKAKQHETKLGKFAYELPRLAANVIMHPLDSLSKAITPTEIAGRIAEFKEGVKKALKAQGYTDAQINGLDEDAILSLLGPEINRYVKQSRNLSVDFKRSGAWTKKYKVNMLVNFFNPQIQGMYNTAMLLNPFTPKRFVKTVLKGSLYITMPTVLLWMANHDDEDYKSLPRWRKDFFYNLPLGNGIFLMVPKPFELGIIFGALPERILEQAVADNPEAWRDIESTIAKAITPPMVPSALSPILSLYANRDFLGNPIINEYEKDELPYLQTSFNTNVQVDAFAQFLNRIPVARNIPYLNSPKQLQYLLEGYLGSAGRSVLWAIDSKEDMPTKAQVNVLMSNMTVNVKKSNQDINDFYDNLSYLKSKHNEALKTGIEPDMTNEMLYSIYQSIYSDVKMGNALISQMRKDETLDKADKDQIIISTRDYIIEQVKMANDQYKEEKYGGGE